MTLEEAAVELKLLQKNPTMKTVGQYSPTAEDWPDNILPFVEKHLVYLRTHKHVDPAHYISNLKLTIKIR